MIKATANHLGGNLCGGAFEIRPPGMGPIFSLSCLQPGKISPVDNPYDHVPLTFVDFRELWSAPRPPHAPL